jgi:hypothetical protein
MAKNLSISKKSQKPAALTIIEGNLLGIDGCEIPTSSVEKSDIFLDLEKLKTTHVDVKYRTGFMRDGQIKWHPTKVGIVRYTPCGNMDYEPGLYVTEEGEDEDDSCGYAGFHKDTCLYLRHAKKQGFPFCHCLQILELL